MNGTDANSGIKHPGATLAAMLDLVDMSRKELSLRVGVSEKHIAAVIDGSRDVSLPFAKRDLRSAISDPTTALKNV